MSKRKQKKKHAAKYEMLELLGKLITFIAELLGIASFIWSCVERIF